jgi:uncharacterized protein YgbK (DUF1537 family)
MMLGCIADDVTGATDLAINLVQGGVRVVQWLSMPTVADLRAIEELEETAKLSLLLRDKPTRFLTETQCAELQSRFPS